MSKKILSILLSLVMVLGIFAIVPFTASAASVVKTRHFNNHTYELFSGHTTWKEAKEACESRGGYLAVVNSAEENSFLRSMAAGIVNSAWLGGTDEDSEGEWYWVNGDPFTYTNWYTGEPNNANENEHYMELYSFSGGRWFDLSNDNAEPTGFICEYDPITTVILGDVDGDGEVTIIDATYIQRYEVNITIPVSDEDILLRGDVDGDKEVTVLDATYIQRYDAGFNTPYPIGEAV